MRPTAVVAFGAVSPLGSGRVAVSVGAPGERPASRVGRDSALVELGLARPVAARATLPTGDGDRAQLLLSLAAEALAAELDRVLPDWRERRLALAVGTSAGGMPTLERALELRARGARIQPNVAREALYDGPLVALSPLFSGPTVQVLAACASSTMALGLGARWLEAEHAELVIAGGYDALSDFVATGFESLGATTARGLEPFRTNRDGMALGEGAALLALVRASDARAPLGYVVGFGVTNDAVHLTAPDPEGRGLERAASQALDDAALGPEAVELVSAHATATAHNDRAEARAISRALGAAAARAVVHPFKASIGHCLGAAGALETLSALFAMDEAILPGALGSGPSEAEFQGRLLERNEAGSVDTCLKLSAGFGGSNAALVVQARPPALSGRARARRRVFVLRAGTLVKEPSFEAISSRAVVPDERVLRFSRAGGLAATAIVEALAELEPLPGLETGVVVGTTVACLDENERFDRVRRERGPRAVEPRRFSRTSPNVPAGECAIAFGFSGPAFAVGGGPRAPLEALLVGHDLVESGDADRVLVVACDDVGDVSRELFEIAGLKVPVSGALAVVLGKDGPGRALERTIVATELGRARYDEAGSSLLVSVLARATAPGA